MSFRPRFAPVLLCTLLAAACAPKWQGEQEHYSEIFRWINVGFGRDSIRLGEPFHRAAEYVTRVRDTLYAVRPGTFGGADSIYLDVTPTGVVKAMRFVYGSDVKYGALVEEYAALFGGPGTQVRMAREPDSTTWIDPQTRFVIFAPQTGSRVRSVLADRQLSLQQPHN